jgi:hypothetical protein
VAYRHSHVHACTQHQASTGRRITASSTSRAVPHLPDVVHPDTAVALAGHCQQLLLGAVVQRAGAAAALLRLPLLRSPHRHLEDALLWPPHVPDAHHLLATCCCQQRAAGAGRQVPQCPLAALQEGSGESAWCRHAGMMPVPLCLCPGSKGSSIAAWEVDSRGQRSRLIAWQARSSPCKGFMQGLARVQSQRTCSSMAGLLLAMSSTHTLKPSALATAARCPWLNTRTVHLTALQGATAACSAQIDPMNPKHEVLLRSQGCRVTHSYREAARHMHSSLCTRHLLLVSMQAVCRRTCWA